MSRRPLAALLLAAVLVALAAQAAACGGASSDPFAGTWWEPSSGRRVQVTAAGDGYDVRFGADLEACPATVSGDELRVTHPELGEVVLKTAPNDRLELVIDGTASLLERAPQHQ